jgi:hypothetical protein
MRLLAFACAATLSIALAVHAADPAPRKAHLAAEVLDGKPFVVTMLAPESGLPSPGGAGLVFGVTSPKDLCAAWISPGCARLMRLAAGAWQQVASAPLPPDLTAGRREWRLYWWPGEVAVACDGVSVLAWRGDLPSVGRAGAAASSESWVPAQVSARPLPMPVFTDRFQWARDAPNPWKAVSGQWRIDAIQDPLLRRDRHLPKSSRYRGVQGCPSVALTGEDSWGRLVAGASVQLARPESAGLVFGWRDDRNYGYMTVRRDEAGGEARLGAFVNGEDRLLARKPLAVGIGHWLRPRVEVGADEVRGYVGRVEVGSGRPTGPVFGRVGMIVAESGDAIFDDFEVEPLTAQAQAATQQRQAVLFQTGFGQVQVTGGPRIQAEALLGDILRPSAGTWAVASSDGDPRLAATGVGRNALWFHRPVPGDASFEARVRLPRASGAGAATAGLVIAADKDGVGYALALTPGRARLLRGDVELAAQEAGDLTAWTPVRLERRGRDLLAQAGRIELRASDVQPLDGERLGLWAVAGSEFDDLAVANNVAAAYRFENSEPDWRPSAGRWLEHSGMTCIAWGYWIGAYAEPDALLWNAFVWPDHVTASVWVSEASDGEESGHHLHYPYHDVQVVLAGNGRDADHGYRFVIAGGPDRNLTRLYRNGQAVAETRQFSIVMGGHCNHPRMFQVTAQRRCGEIELRIDGQVLLSYTDPKPLGPGQIGIGSVGCRADFRDFLAYVDRPWLCAGLPAAW